MQANHEKKIIIPWASEIIILGPVSNNDELGKEFNSLRNLIHGIIRCLLKLLILVLKNQCNFTVH